MKTSLDCIPCLLRQAIEAARMVSSSSAVHEKIIREVLPWFEEMDFHQSPPAMAQRIHRRLREITGDADPYRKAKDRFNHMAMDMIENLRIEIDSAEDALLMAVRFAITGNIIDMGVTSDISASSIQNSFQQLYSEPHFLDMKAFKQALHEANTILYLLDNAGEIAFDKLLIERLLPKRVIAAARGFPVINDATTIDARAVGLDRLVQVIDNGSDAPGTILSDCSPEFQSHFKNADMIIAKGMGNYESLSHESENIFFLFKVKCAVIADQTRRPLGAQILIHSNSRSKGE
ncbi:MAG: DUF89 family protein [Anaerolineales bacterium]|nr:DUF89 family protein [Anaerolineales bacterium]